ncbi:signal peptidase I Serine peptidase. MEROPS family S26A [Actinacidiphila yanglinensis]|uniref:Signal peptidase I n=1 Tax=Actinacidiphila yanglinensis TaxID=310779 RepID=A0A1H6E6S7_9ACTN|nr:signal peptidase I [Actinacidiphila yanglinensis]SEG92666.1 signal peptidase I Serine peptidase. MEROPS family S26A [Actinacidiphila yanglinensis]
MGNRGRPRGTDAPPAPLVSGSRVERRKLARKVKRKRRRSRAREVPLLILVALGIALVLKTFLIQAFVIPSGSMEQTIRIGDRVLVDKLTPWFGAEPHRGDVVVFKDPGGWLQGEPAPKPDPVVVKQVKQVFTFIGLLPASGEQDLIKRVIGVGGDTVSCKGTGPVTVNGKPLDEPYVYPGNTPCSADAPFTVHVPLGRLWVMGDHRQDSADSRYHMAQVIDGKRTEGTIAQSLVVGRAFVIGWPIGHWTRLSEPSTFGSVPRADAAIPAGTAGTAMVDRADSSANNGQRTDPLPTPAELPLVMGMVGLRRSRGRRRYRMRSGCGGPGGRRTVRFRRAREGGRPGVPCGRHGGRWRGPRRGVAERCAGRSVRRQGPRTCRRQL